MSLTPQAFHFHLKHLTDADQYLIAYSGGIDSHVLLHLCAQLKNSPNGFDQSFSAVYIDHGLSVQAKKWGQHCQHICFELDIPLTIIEVDARAKKRQSPEASARIARYQAFSRLLAEDECLLTAQHLDDQAETLLLQLLRGSGVRGLASMPRVKYFADGFLCRPMLDYKKQDIVSYAEQHQLQWVDDESNQQQRYDRNYLRHSVLPLLEKRWPSVQKNFSKSAELLGEAQFLMDEMAESDIQSLYFINETGAIEQDKLLLKPVLALLEKAKNTIHSSGLSPRTSPYKKNTLFHGCSYNEQGSRQIRLNNVLRYWINLNHLPLPSKKILEQIVISVIGAGEDKSPLVYWKRDSFHCEIRKYRDKIYLRDVSNSHHQLKQTHNTQQHYLWSKKLWSKKLLSKNEALEIIQNTDNNLSRCIIKLLPAQESGKQTGFNQQALLSKELIVSFRQGGERFRKTADAHSQQLKHWFQEQGIPPWEREQIPLIYWGEELIQVGNDIVNESLSSDDKDNSLIICWISADWDEFSDKKR